MDSFHQLVNRNGENRVANPQGLEFRSSEPFLTLPGGQNTMPLASQGASIVIVSGLLLGVCIVSGRSLQG